LQNLLCKPAATLRVTMGEELSLDSISVIETP
jgi:hypothetical protein